MAGADERRGTHLETELAVVTYRLAQTRRKAKNLKKSEAAALTGVLVADCEAVPAPTGMLSSLFFWRPPTNY